MFFHSNMTSYLWIVLLANLVATKAQDLDLFDALDDEKPPTKPPLKPVPPKNTNTEGFDLLDAFDNDPKNPSGDPKKTSGDGFDLSDALGPGKNRNTEPKKPVVKPPQDSGTGGRDLDDKDLFDLNNGDYKPDGGQSGGRGSGPGYEGGASDQPQEGGGALAAIISSVGVALLGAASSYFAYQKKKLCFKVQGGQDPESGKNPHGGASDNHALSNLLSSS
ncbi:CD99 molecule isoform X2 [Paramisgurnus dabryanus]|uniref:CD99 molecule isoform X2 n=1 Tax=Paramisgurnus dabryanus TaxID=90735 RepID=UPI003CCFBA0F